MKNLALYYRFLGQFITETESEFQVTYELVTEIRRKCKEGGSRMFLSERDVSDYLYVLRETRNGQARPNIILNFKYNIANLTMLNELRMLDLPEFYPVLSSEDNHNLSLIIGHFIQFVDYLNNSSLPIIGGGGLMTSLHPLNNSFRVTIPTSVTVSNIPSELTVIQHDKEECFALQMI